MKIKDSLYSLHRNSTSLSTDTSTHYIWYHIHDFFLLFKIEEKHSGRNTEFSGNGLHNPVTENQTSVHYHGETKGQKQTKKPNSKGHWLAKRTLVEVLKPQCGFISQCGLRRKQHFQGDNMAPKYHKCMSKSIQIAAIPIPALKNKSNCTGNSINREAKETSKGNMCIRIQVIQPGHLLSSQNVFNSLFQNKLTNYKTNNF